MKKISCLIVLLAGMTILANAQWSTNPAVNNAICNLAGEQALPKVCPCSNGDTYIAYFSSESGNYNIRLQRLDVLGNKLWTPNGILISNNPSMSWLTDWDATADPSGYCMLTLQDIRNGNNNIYAYRIAPDGSFAWGPNGVTLSNNMAFNASPKVIATAAGNAIVAWAADSVIIMQKITPTGTLSWGTNGKTWAPTGASGTHRWSWPQLMPVGSDDFLMKYFEDNGSTMYPTRYIWVQRFNASGNGVWASPASVSSAGGIASFTQIISFINDNSDGCFLAWHDDRDNDMKSNSWVQHINSSGAVTLGTNGTEVCNNNANNHFYPEAACPAGSPDVYVFWNEMNSLQSQTGIYGQKISTAGVLQWGTTGLTVVPVSTTEIHPQATRTYMTDMVVFYDEYVTGADQLLKAIRVTPSGTFPWPGNSVTVSSVVSSKVHTEVSALYFNQWILAWEDDRGTDADIYAQNLKPAGDLGPVGPLTYGNITGQVTVVGGTASVTSVTVTAGVNTTHPDATGHYAFNNILTGTYTVNASLPGYTSGQQTGVVVLDNQTTSNVNFTLEYIPVTGFITGTVTLNGGPGNVALTVVSAGTYSTNPAANGTYSLEVPGGTYTVTASLTGYTTGSAGNVVVVNGQTTPNINITLNPTGSIQGQVTLTGGTGNVTQTIVSAGSYSTHPDAFGYYGMDVPVGSYTVTASLSGYGPESISNVIAVSGSPTTGVNFSLSPLLTSGTIEGDITLEPTGIANVTSVIVSAGTFMTNPDANGHYSLVVEAGTYDVTAHLQDFLSDTAYIGVTVTVGQTVTGKDFHLIWTLGVPGRESGFSLQVTPNPTGPDGTIRFTLPRQGSYTFGLFDPSGRRIADVTRQFSAGQHELPLSAFGSVMRSGGVFLLRVAGQGKEQAVKFLYSK